MKKAEQIKTKQEQVFELLTLLPETRSNDRELVVAMWRTEQPNICNYGSADSLLRAYLRKELSNPDDITRTRRKVQELNPHLKADYATEMQRKEAEINVRSEMPGGDLFATLGETFKP